jgi:rod shape determining protein RodA
MVRVRTDLWIILCYLLAAAISLIMLSSVAPDRLAQQAFMFVFGLGLILYIGSQEGDVYETFAPLSYLGAVLMLLVTFALGATIRGSTRWIMIGGFQLQGGELAKPLLALAFAHFLEKYPPNSLRHLLLHLALSLLPIMLIFRQPDLGTALVVASIWLAELFVAGIPLWIVGLGGVSFLGLLQYLSHILHGYQLRRLETFLDPYQDPTGSGYNVIQSMIAIGSGGIWGKGLGHGTQSHLAFLPERHTDFAFASIAEELGLFGSLAMLAVLGGLLLRLLHLATRARDMRARLIVVGVAAALLFQTGVNMGMNLGVAPVTGVTLPLISYGGSSILAISLMLGLVISVAKENNFRYNRSL